MKEEWKLIEKGFWALVGDQGRIWARIHEKPGPYFERYTGRKVGEFVTLEDAMNYRYSKPTTSDPKLEPALQDEGLPWD